MKRTSIRKMAIGGEMTQEAILFDPNDPEKRLSGKQIKDKYKNNRYVTAGRENWGEWLDKSFPTNNGVKFRDSVSNVAKSSGVNPGLLYTSAMEEGMQAYISKPDAVSESYGKWADKNPQAAGKFMVDGFYNYGLDTFGSQYERLAKKGYLPEGFKDRFTPFEAQNEKKEKVMSAAFMSDEDALMAKSAMMRDSQDYLTQAAKKRGLNLSDKQKEFFTVAGYNAGHGNLDKMIDSYNSKGYLKDDKFLDPSFKPASWGGVYDNVQKRIQNKNVLESEGFFKHGGSIEKYQFGTQNPIGPGDDLIVDANMGPQMNEGAQLVGANVWGNPNDLQNSVDGSQNNPLQNNLEVPQEEPQQQNKFANYGKVMGGIEKGLSAGIVAINSALSDANTRREESLNRRRELQRTQMRTITNPYAQGTGSQAIMKNGGYMEAIDGSQQGIQTLEGGRTELISSSDHSNPMVEFKGREHKDDGIKIGYAQQIAEVEDKEVGFIDQEGGLNIFGKLKVPGSNKTFRKFAKDIAKEEEKVDGKKSKYLKILNGADEADKYQESALSTAKVMFKSLDKQSMDIAEQKEALADYQNLILSMTEQQGVMKFGGEIKEYAEGGTIGPGDPEFNLDAALKAIAGHEGGKVGMRTNLKGSDGRRASASGTYQMTTPTVKGVWNSHFKSQYPNFEDFKKKFDTDGTLEYQVAKAHLADLVKSYGPEYALGAWYSPAHASRASKGDTKALSEIPAKEWGNKQTFGDYLKDINSRYAKASGASEKIKIGGVEFSKKDAKMMYDLAKGDDGHMLHQIAKSEIEKLEQFIGEKKNNTPFNYGGIDFNPNDARSLYTMANTDPEHPLNSPGNQDMARLQQYLGMGGPGDKYPKGFKQFYDKKNQRQYNSPEGLSPAAFYNDPEVVEGLRLDQTYPKAIDDANWGPEHQKVWDKLSAAKKKELSGRGIVPVGAMSSIPQNVNRLGEKVATFPATRGTTTGTGRELSTTEKLLAGQGIDTPYGKASAEPNPSIDGAQISGDMKRGDISPLSMLQITPELITLSQGRDPVYARTYQPELKQTFDISYQLGRNENQATFNQSAKIAEMTGNIDAVSQLAAQKYQADQQYNMQEVQGNATQKLGVYGQNVDTLNQAQLQNLQILDQQQVRQAQAVYNTRKERNAAISSISSKALQNQLENKTYNAYSALFKNYGFDKKGNVVFNPQDGRKFTEGEAVQFGFAQAQGAANNIMNGDFSRQFTKIKNEDGSQTTTETLGANKKIQEEYKTLKNQGFDDGLIGNMLRAKYPETINQ